MLRKAIKRDLDSSMAADQTMFSPNKRFRPCAATLLHPTSSLHGLKACKAVCQPNTLDLQEPLESLCQVLHGCAVMLPNISGKALVNVFGVIFDNPTLAIGVNAPADAHMPTVCAPMQLLPADTLQCLNPNKMFWARRSAPSHCGRVSLVRTFSSST